MFDYVGGMLMNLGPYAAGASVTAFRGMIPLPRAVEDTLSIAPPAVWTMGAGYMAAAPGEDKACAALKGFAGGTLAAVVLNVIR